MYIITGGAGFIGSNIAAALDHQKLGKIVLCDRLRSGEKWRNIAKREISDFVFPENLLECLNDNRSHIQCVFHMGAGAVSPSTKSDPDQILEANFKMSVTLFNWCVQHQVPFLYASSAAVYGDGSHGFNDDGSVDALAKLQPTNAYAWSKHLFDRKLARMALEGAPMPPQWAGFRFFNLYGPNEYHKGHEKSIIAKIYETALSDTPFNLFKSAHPDYPDGGQLRDFLWIGDCVNVILWYLANQRISGLFNCGTGQARSMVDAVRLVYQALDMDPNIEFETMPHSIRDKFQYLSEANIERLREVGYPSKFTTLEDGVNQYVRNYLNSQDPYL